ncbi:MAG: (2Fe-2S)-binding protein [Acidobacteria bacterium]|nr:(2Fe-2S)-binding protein [Acidobacteriota bacterium]
MSSSDERQDTTADANNSGESAVSRRKFLKGTGVALTIPLVTSGEKVVKAAGAEVKIYGPSKTDITLTINGSPKKVSVEPRATLLDTLRNDLDTTGAKRVCDRATCGACTVVMDGKPVYGCTVLAIEAQGKKIETVESLAKGDTLHPVQQAFWDNDAQQCGFCTPGFVMACKALLDKHPSPTEEQIEMGVGGNLCRCGTYHGIKGAIAQASAALKNGPAKMTRGGKSNG